MSRVLGSRQRLFPVIDLRLRQKGKEDAIVKVCVWIQHSWFTTAFLKVIYHLMLWLNNPERLGLLHLWIIYSRLLQTNKVNQRNHLLIFLVGIFGYREILKALLRDGFTYRVNVSVAVSKDSRWIFIVYLKLLRHSPLYKLFESRSFFHHNFWLLREERASSSKSQLVRSNLLLFLLRKLLLRECSRPWGSMHLLLWCFR